LSKLHITLLTSYTQSGLMHKIMIIITSRQ